MSDWLGDIPAGSTLPVFFTTYDSAGASVTLSGLAVTDIEIYKGASITQRSSDAGYALIDTDGIDVDSTTGLHAFSIDLSNNTDSGFYAAGSYYTIVVSAVTVDSQTVTFIPGRFRIVTAEVTTGTPVATASALDTQAKADVNAEVLDVLNVDTFAQTGQEAPAATQTIRKMIGYLYKAWRNKSTQTATQYSLFNDDAATVDQKADTSDNDTTFTRGEVATGP